MYVYVSQYCTRIQGYLLASDIKHRTQEFVFFSPFLHASGVVYDQNVEYFIRPISGNYSVRSEHCKNKKQGKIYMIYVQYLWDIFNKPKQQQNHKIIKNNAPTPTPPILQ